MSVSRSSELRRKESWAGLLAAPPFFFLALTCSGTRNRARSSETQDKVQMCLTLRREIHAPQIPANLQQHPQEASPRQFGLAAVPSEGGQAPGITRVVAEPVGMAQIFECRLQEGEKRFAIGHRRRQENQGLNKSKALAAR